MELELVIVSIFVMMASFVQGALGFGFALIFTTLMMLVYPSQIVIPLALLMGLLMNGILYYTYHRSIDYLDTFILFVASIPGIWLASYYQYLFNLDALKIAIGLILMLTVVILYRKIHVIILNRLISNTVAGFFSGALTTLTSMGGPPLALFYLVSKKKKNSFKANIVFFFLMSGCVVNISYFYTGRTSVSLISDYWYLFIYVMCFTWIGIKSSQKVNQQQFEKWVMLFLLIIGLTLCFG